MSGTYRLAVVGAGGIADVHAAAVGRLAPRARLTAAADVDAGRLRGYCERWSVPGRYDGLGALLEHERPGPDLVLLCTPPAAHRDQAVTCLGRGVSVLCEKPPALNLAGLDAVAAAEARGGGHFATVFQHRFGSGARTLRRLAGDPRLGPAATAVCHTLWYRTDDYFAVGWRGRWETEGGGPTMGHGIHQMDLLLSVLGEWRECVAVAARRSRPTATEDLSCALVTFADGSVATVVNSLVSPSQTSFLRFDFAHATLEVEHLYGYGDGNWRVTAAPGHAEEVTAAWAEGPKGVDSGHHAQLAAVLDALDAGRPPPVRTADSRATLELVAAVYASAFTGKRIRRGEIAPGSPFYDRMQGGGPPWPPWPPPDGPEAVT